MGIPRTGARLRLVKRIFLALLVAAPLLALGQASFTLDYPSAIAKAGRQRMLAEYMMKEYLQLAEGIGDASARGHLAEAIWVFDDQVGDLKGFKPTPELEKTVAELAAQWLEFRKIITTPPSRAAVTALRATGARLHEAAERNTAALVSASGSSLGRIVGLAGRQRMLSQRIAKTYLLLSARVDEAAAREELQAAREQFEAAQRELSALPGNTDEINAALAGVQSEWAKLDRMIRAERLDRALRKSVIESADNILSRMENVTAMYTRLAQR